MHMKTCSKVWCSFREGVSLLGLGKAIGIGVEENSVVSALDFVRMFKRILMPRKTFQIHVYGHLQL